MNHPVRCTLVASGGLGSSGEPCGLAEDTETGSALDAEDVSPSPFTPTPRAHAHGGNHAAGPRETGQAARSSGLTVRRCSESAATEAGC